MNTLKRFVFLTFVFGFSIFEIGFCQSNKSYLRSGNKDYEKRKYSEAEIEYRRALSEDSTYEKALYNLANSLYKQKQFKEANLYYQKLANNQELPGSLRANAFYGMGNAYLQQAKGEQGKDDRSALKNLKQSIESYKNTLRLNPNDQDAKYNLAYAMKFLPKPEENNQQNKESKKDSKKEQQDKDKKEQDKKQQQDKDKQKQEQEEQNKDNQQQNKNSQDKNQQNANQVENSWQNQQKKSQGNQDDSEKGEQPQDKPNQPQQKEEPQQKNGEGQKNPQMGESKPSSGQYSEKDIKKADAERVLEALKNNEKKTLEKTKIKVQGKQTDKDW